MTSLADLYGDGFSADINWTAGTTAGPVCNIILRQQPNYNIYIEIFDKITFINRNIG